MVERLAKIYNLSTNIRATDHLRMIDAGLLPQFKLVQSISEHSDMTARVVEFAFLSYNDVFCRANFLVRPEHASFLATHHDDSEWWTLDMVPVLGYLSFSSEEKHHAEQEAIDLLLGEGDNLLRSAYEEYEARQTPDAILAKTCDILELFCHNRILASHGLGIITWANYKNCAPETQSESEYFLRLHDKEGITTPVTIAEILEKKYTDRFLQFNFPSVIVDFFDEVVETIRIFPFKDIVRIDR